MSNSGALNLLSVYNSDSDSENDIPGPRVSVKRCFHDDNESFKTVKRLPVPSILQPKAECNNENDQSELHEGRIRSFPHERGNWSTYVFIPHESQEHDVMSDLIGNIISNCKHLTKFYPADNLHISLTKTVVIRHHWIESFVKSVSENISHVTRFIILFDKIKIYCNDERTRTFIGLQIKSGHDSILTLVKALDQCLKEFNLPEFYTNPSFHMSLVWCVGDYEAALNNMLDQLNEVLFEYMTNFPDFSWYIHVQNLVCKTGNKMYKLNLNTAVNYI